MYYLEKLVLAYVIRKDGGADGSGGKLLLIFTANIHDRIFARISNKNWKKLWKKLVYFKRAFFPSVNQFNTLCIVLISSKKRNVL